MDSKAPPRPPLPRQEVSRREAGRAERRGPADEREETRWVIEQIQQSFR